MSTPDSQLPEPQGSRRSSATLILALVAVGVIVLGAVTVTVLHHSGGGDRSGAAAPTPGSAPAATGEGQTGFAVPDVDAFGRRVDIPNNPAGQALPQTIGPHAATDPAWLTAAPILPEQGGWQRVHGASVPFSTSDGPTNVIDGVPVGYSHTPQGAALAAVFTAWEAFARPSDWPLRERMEVMTDADHAEFNRLQAAGKVPDQAPASATRWLVAPDAFQIESFSATGDLCVLKIATKAAPASAGGPAQWTSSQLTMVWDGQWRLRLASDKHLPTSMIGSLEGWTRW